MEKDKLYTYDRLSQFVDNYTEFVKEKKEEQSSPSTENYNYYHFETSPDAINSDSVGRFGSSLFTDVNSQWKAMGGSNGINAWKLNLGKKMIALKNTHNASVVGGLQAGLSYTIKKFNNYSNITDITKLNVQPYDLLAQVAYVDTVSELTGFQSESQCPTGYGAAGPTTPGACFTPYSSILSTPETRNTAFTTTVYNPSSVNTNNIISIEWNGYFYQEINGIYTFTATIPDNCLYYIWFGDKSVCEFTSTNADIHNTQNKYQILIENGQPVPIRIQCIFIDQSQPDVNLTITRTQMTGETVSEQQPIALDGSLRDSSVKPFVFYAAFVSTSQKQFLNNEFTCYSLVTDNSDVLAINGDPSDFYKKFRQGLLDVINLKYDYNSSNRLSYGVIPSIKTQYTISSDTSSLPFAYSIYRLHTDSRMGNTYQINTAMNEQTLHPMQKFGDNNSIIEYSNTFTTKTNYYPNSSLLTASNVGAEDGLACKEKCISDPTCNHYYTFTSNNGTDDKCITSTLATPEFNRVIPPNSTIPIDPNSSSLYTRNYQIEASGSNCGTDLKPSNIIPVNSTTNYSTTFEYSNYNVNTTEITKPEQVGVCGSPGYNKQKNDAYDILFNPSTYSNGGKSWTESFTGSKKTQAIDDTSDAIQTNLENEQIYANKMESINTKETELSQNLIPQYRETREIMENNPIYDYNGDSLLYFRNKPIPQLREKRVMDNNQQYVTSQLMLSLGTLSAATLIVFAIMLARE
jgi:hypothetical protein